MSIPEQLRSTPTLRYSRNYDRVIWKEISAKIYADHVAVAPDPLLETQRSLGAWSSLDSQRTSRGGDDNSAPASQRRRPATGSLMFDALSRSASLPANGPQRAEVPAAFGSGFLGKPNYIDPLADKSLRPRPDPGIRIAAGPDYIPCHSTGRMGIMTWEQGRSHKSAACIEREMRASSRGPAATSGVEEPGLATLCPILSPPKLPPNGFGAKPERVQRKHIHFTGLF